MLKSRTNLWLFVIGAIFAVCLVGVIFGVSFAGEQTSDESSPDMSEYSSIKSEANQQYSQLQNTDNTNATTVTTTDQLREAFKAGGDYTLGTSLTLAEDLITSTYWEGKTTINLNFNGYTINCGSYKFLDWDSQVTTKCSINLYDSNTGTSRGGFTYANQIVSYQVHQLKPNDYSSSVNFTNLIINGNSSESSNSALYFNCKSTNKRYVSICVFGCDFKNCLSTGDSGAIDAKNCSFLDLDYYNEFSNCKGVQGGAIKSDGTRLVCDDTTFSNCTTYSTNGSGGAIATIGSEAYSANSFIFQCDFEGCGGSNIANGGALYLQGWGYGSQSTVNKCTFTNCTAKYGTSGRGGAVYASNTKLYVLQNSEFTSCSSTYSGGAIYSNGCTDPDDESVKQKPELYWKSACLTISECGFDLCTSNTNGGAINMGESSYIKFADIKNCVIQGCSSTNGGGMYFEGYNIHLAGVRFQSYTNGTACSASYGGGLYINRDQNPDDEVTGVLSPYVKDCTFDSCTATSDGGGVYYTSWGNDVVFNGSTKITGCTASSSGAGLKAVFNAWSASDAALKVANNLDVNNNKVSGNDDNVSIKCNNTTPSYWMDIVDTIGDDFFIGLDVDSSPAVLQLTNGYSKYCSDGANLHFVSNNSSYHCALKTVTEANSANDDTKEAYLISGAAPTITVGTIADQKYTEESNPVSLTVTTSNFSTTVDKVNVAVTNKWGGYEVDNTDVDVSSGKVTFDTENYLPGAYVVAVYAYDGAEPYLGYTTFNVEESDTLFATAIKFNDVTPTPDPDPTPDPTPNPTPVVDNGSSASTSSTSDVLNWQLLAALLMLACACGCGVLIYKKKTAGAHANNKCSQILAGVSTNSKLLVVAASAFMAGALLFGAMYANSTIKAFAENQNNEGSQVVSKLLAKSGTSIEKLGDSVSTTKVAVPESVTATVNTQTPSVEIANSYIKNDKSQLTTITSVNVVTEDSTLTDANWIISAGDTELYNGKANDEQEISLDVAAGATQQITISSNISAEQAASFNGKAPVSITFGGGINYQYCTVSGTLTNSKTLTEGHDITNALKTVTMFINGKTQSTTTTTDLSGNYTFDYVPNGCTLYVVANNDGYYGMTKLDNCGSGKTSTVDVKEEGPALDNYTLAELKAVSNDLSANTTSSVYYNEFVKYMGSAHYDSSSKTWITDQAEQIWYSHSCGQYDEEDDPLNTTVLDDTYKCQFNSSEDVDNYLFLRVIGINQDTKSDGSGTAGLTLQTYHPLPDAYEYSDYAYDCDLSTGEGYWWGKDTAATTSIRGKLNVSDDGTEGSVYSGLADVFKTNIVNVDKVSQIYRYASDSVPSSNYTSLNGNDTTKGHTSDRLFLLSYSEMSTRGTEWAYNNSKTGISYDYKNYSAYSGTTSTTCEGLQYAWYSSHNVRGDNYYYTDAKASYKTLNSNPALSSFEECNSGKQFSYPGASWTRSVCIKFNKDTYTVGGCLAIGYYGSLYNPSAAFSDSRQVCPAFCL